MQFKHPELLYTLFLLVIPIIVHLFQLRKFQKEAFTNVAFLKEVSLQTRKSSQLKKWLTLLTRLLLLSALILAFAQPFTSKSNNFNTKKETVIYLDNSFSMQAKGAHGELLKRAVQDIIGEVPEDEEISIITNNQTFKNTTLKSVKNELLQLNYASNQLPYEVAVLKSKKLFGKNPNSSRNLVMISDFQQKNEPFVPKQDSLTQLHLVQVKPMNKNNVSIDSIFISKKSANILELQVNLKNNGESIENLAVSLYDDSNLIAKTAVSINADASTTFSIPANKIINGKISIDDNGLQFDNTLYFNINEPTKVSVLSINEGDDHFLSRIFTTEEFIYTSTPIEQLNYNDIDKQNLIVLNELSSITNSLISVLNAFTNNGGYVVIIPSTGTNFQTYNNLFLNWNIPNFNTLIESEKRITTINYSHPVYAEGVFEKRVDNFQYPKVNSYYTLTSNTISSILQFEDNKPFLFQKLNAFVFTAALNKDNSNFINSPLIVPTLYNIGRASLKTSGLYYEIGRENTFDVSLELQQDDILSLKHENINIIPRQQYFNNKVKIITDETPSTSGIYSVNNKDDIIKNVSYNYSRDESNLVYQNMASLSKDFSIGNSITSIFDTIKSDSNINELWRWFVIFALLFLIIEMLLLKYLK